MKANLVVLSLLLVLIAGVGFVSASDYVIEEDFGSIEFWYSEEGLGAISQTISGTESGARADYFFTNTNYDKDISVTVNDLNHEIGYNEFSSFIEQITFGADYDYDPIGESNSAEGYDEAQILFFPQPDSYMLAIFWTSYDKVIAVIIDDERTPEEGGNMEDYNQLMNAYFTKYPSTLVITEDNETGMCTDTDGGKNYFSEGETFGGIGDFGDDRCCDSEYNCGGYSGEYVKERYCENNIGVYEFYKCLNGCEDSVCIEENDDRNDDSTCTDTDNGKDYFIKGIAEKGTTDKMDYCKDGIILYEMVCSGDDIKTVEYECEYGCENGACFKEATCTDTDGGKNYFEAGTTRGYENGNIIESSDGCRSDGKTLAEVYCDGVELKVEQHVCSNGCVSNACVPCQGCELNDSCYPVNTRKDREYCSVDKVWIVQGDKEESCDNNFECKSNLCIADECVSVNLWAKFMRWLSRVFGN